MSGLFDDLDAQYGGNTTTPGGIFDDLDMQHGSPGRKKRTLEDYASAYMPQPVPEEPGILREAADTGLSVAKGAVGIVEAGANLFGADNAVSRGLSSTREYLGSLESEQQQAQRKLHAQRSAEAEATGSMWEEGKAAVKNFLEDPIDYTAEGVGSLAGFGPVGLIAKGAKIAGVGARAATQVGLGAGYGVGSVKGQQYTQVRDALIREGYSPEEADSRAAEHQSYSMDNAVDLLGGAALGALAGGTGAESLMLGTTRMAGKGLVKRGVAGSLAEAPMEAAQGGQERLAGNRAMDREGYDIDPWQGVFGQAVTEGLMSAPLGAGLGMAQGYTPTQAEIDEQTRQEADAQIARNEQILEANRQAEAEARAVQEKQSRDQQRTYFAQQVPFEPWKKERIAQIVEEHITPEVIDSAYEQAFNEAVANEIAPPDRTKFEADYKKRATKEISKDTEALTQEYYAHLDNLAATDVDLLGDPVELKPEPTTEAEPEQGLSRNKRQMDFLGELDRTAQPDYTPVMPVSTQDVGNPATTVFTQTPVDDSGLPGARNLAEERARAGGVIDTPPNMPVSGTPEPKEGSGAAIAREVAINEAGATPGAWAKFVSKNELTEADAQTIADTIREKKFGGQDAETIADEILKRAGIAQPVQPAAVAAPLLKGTQDVSLQNQVPNEEGRNGQEGNPQARAIRVTQGAADGRGENALPVAQGSQNALSIATPTGLSENQQKVWDVLVSAVQNNELDKFQQATAGKGERKFNHTAIAEAAGIGTRQASQAAVKQTIDKWLAQLGTTEEGMRDFLRTREKAVRTTEASDTDMLGTNPSNFTKTSLQAGATLDNADLFGNDEGATAGFGVIESAGGSQSETDPDMEANAMAAERPDPVYEARVAAARAQREAFIAELLASDIAVEAAEDWDDMRGPTDPYAKDLSREDAYDWTLNFAQLKSGAINVAELEEVYQTIIAGHRNAAGETAAVDVQPDGAQPARQIEAGKAVAETRLDPKPKPAQEVTPATEPVVKRKKKVVDVKAKGMTAQAETAVEDNPDILMLNELRRLSSKDAKRGPIAKDFLDRAKNGEDIRAEAGAWLNAVTADERGSPLESRGTVGTGQDAGTLRAYLRKMFVNPALFDKRVTVVQNESEVPAQFRGANTSESSGNTTRLAFYDPNSGHIWMIAGNIPKGRELGVFLHEAGGHMGMLNLLGRANYNTLVKQIEQWANGEGSVENEVAAAAWMRLEDAKTGKDLPQATLDDELIAYFIEEAVAAGINPTAIASQPKVMQQWFLRLWAAVKSAVQKLGLNPSKLTARDVVDLAYGAARLELSGSTSDIDAANGASGRPATEVMYNDVAPKNSVVNTGSENLLMVLEDVAPEVLAFERKMWGKYVKPEQVAARVLTKLERELESAKSAATSNRVDAVQFKMEALGDRTGVYGAVANGRVDLAKAADTKAAKIESDIAKLKSAMNVAPLNSVITKRVVEAAPEPLKEPINVSLDKVGEVFTKLTNYSVFTSDLVERIKDVLPSAEAWYKAIRGRETMRIKHEARIDDIATEVDALADQAQFNRTWTLIRDMTTAEKWGYQPTWRETVQVDPAMKERYDALSDAEKKVIDSVFKNGYDTIRETQAALDKIADDMYAEKLAKARTDKAKDKLTSEQTRFKRLFGKRLSMMQGPYSPMRRVGNYVTVGKSQRFADLEARAKNDQRAADELENLRSEPDHYMVVFSNSLTEAKAEERSMAGTYAVTSASAKEHFTNSDYLPFQAFESLRQMAEQNDDASGKVLQMIDDLYLTSLADTSARKSELKRAKVSGLNADTMYKAFLAKGKADAHYIAILKTHGEVADRFNGMRREVKDYAHRADKMEAYNELKVRYDNSFNYDPSPAIGKMMNLTATWMLLTKPAYYAYNLTQPMMMTQPYLAQTHGYKKSFAAMTQAYRDLIAAQTSFSKQHLDTNTMPTDVRGMLNELRDSGHLDITITQDLGSRIHSRGDMPSKLATKLTGFFRTAAQKTETANRIVTAVSAYRLAGGKANHEAAINYARQTIDRTQGDYSNFNAPRLLNATNFRKFITQFRKFQFIQAGLLLRMVKDSFSGHEQAAARRALAYMLGHHAVMAGAVGLPLFNVVAMAFAASGDDDEPRDLELWMRQKFGNDAMGTLLTSGLPAALLNVNVSSNLGMGQTFSVVPYANIDPTRDGFNSVVTSALGPTFGLGAQAWEATGKLSDGDYYGFLTGIAPGLVKTSMKAVSEAASGVENKRGDILVDPDEIHFMSTIAKALGFKTHTDATRQLVRGAQIEFEQFFGNRAADIRKKYTAAYRKGDSIELAELRDRWNELQGFKAQYGFKTQPLSALLKAPGEQMKRERNTRGGVQYRENDEAFVDAAFGDETDDE